MKNAYKWVPVLGKFEEKNGVITFKGGKLQNVENKDMPEMGIFLCNQLFTGGIISADVTFSKVSPRSSCDLIIYYDAQNKYNVNAGFPGEPNLLYAIRHFDSKWTYHNSSGNGAVLEAGRKYNLKAKMDGSFVALQVDGVDVVKATLPFSLPQSQVGLWCLDYHDITISNYAVINEKPKVFVIMEFNQPYNDVYMEVIKKVCQEMSLIVIRADEHYGPGLILADIVKSITEAKIIIADITPVNANVFYELGYAHALNKQAILIAEKSTKLPFDVSPFRTLFYENTIGGKSKLESGLKAHIEGILKQGIRSAT